MEKHINAPLTDEDAKSLHSGDYVYITGTIYTARDAAHLRMYEALDRNEPLPMELAHNIIYYMGLLPRGRAGLSDPQALPLPAVWTNTPRDC